MARDQFQSPAPARPRLLRPLLLGATAIGVFFGGVGAWAAFAPLSSAATAPGQVRVESHRKTVQHLEGGIIRDLLVREGDVVEQGQVLLRLDDVQSSSTADLFGGQRDALLALEARLVAERDGLEEIAMSEPLEARMDEPQVKAIVSAQQRIFESRRTSIAGQVDVLEQRMSQLGAEIDAYEAQVSAAEDQIKIVEEEIGTVRGLIEKKLEKRPRLLSLERELAQLKGSKGQNLGLIARTEQAIGEAKLQVADLRNAQAKEVVAELRDVQVKLGELGDRLRAASDVRDRTQIVAPQAGRVVNLRHFTTGGVVRPGDPILDLVPVDDAFVIESRISPMDIDAVHPGLAAEVKLTALKQRRLPILMGEVISVSADALTDERTGTTYYVAEVVLPDDQMTLLEGADLYPGMPADVMIVTGERTAYEYFADPLRDSFRKAFRED